MKILLILTLSLFSVTSFAKTKAEKAAWKASKEACMMKDSKLKGKKLRKCINEEMKEQTGNKPKEEDK